jgi:tetratricopeptide (TPR) repeat protein
LATFADEASYAVEAAEDSLRLAPRVADARTFAEVIFAAASGLLSVGRGAEGLAAIDAALERDAVSSGAPAVLARLLTMRGNVLLRLGRLADARASLDRAAELLSDERELLAGLVTELVRNAELEVRGFPEGSLERIALFVARVDDAGAHLGRVTARFQLARAHLFAGRPDAALEAIEAGVAIASETRANLGAMQTFDYVRARALLARGEVAEARELVERLILVTDPRPPRRAGSLVIFAEVMIASDAVGERARIESSLTEAAGIAERIGDPGLQASVCTERAHLARALGDPAGWERELREALRIYTAMGATGWMERIAKELAS